MHPCSEMHFFREQLFQFLDLWMLISVTVTYGWSMKDKSIDEKQFRALGLGIN